MRAEEAASNVTAGLPGFLVLFFLGLACWFLFRSMNKRMRRVRYEAGDLTSRRREGAVPATDEPTDPSKNGPAA